MVRIPPVELRVRVRHGRHSGHGRVGTARVVRLRLGRDSVLRQLRVWQWVVDVDERLPALADVLASCEGFLVDDDCGRIVGVVEEAMPHRFPSGAARVLVVRGWGRQRMAVPLGEVVEVAPGGRRLVVVCRAGHAPLARSVGPRRWADAAVAVRSVVDRLADRIGRPGRR